MGGVPKFLVGAASPTALDPLMALWMLRILVPLDGERRFVRLRDFACDRTAELLGLGRWVDEEEAFSRDKVRKQLHELHRQAEKNAAGVLASQPLQGNIARLCDVFHLDEVDGAILTLTVMLKTERLLDDVGDHLGMLSSAQLVLVLAQLLQVAPQHVARALGPKGGLARTGLLSISRGGSDTLTSKLELISNTFGDLIATCEADPLTLLGDIIHPSQPAELGLDDYPHLQADLQLVCPYLRQALDQQRPGVNLLIYGAPGTGKTQLVRRLALEYGCALFEIASEDKDGDPVGGSRRLSALRAAQNIFAGTRTLLLFDEVEDVFRGGSDEVSRFVFGQGTAQHRKAWVNRTLEGNPVPAVWVCNSLSGIDRAFLRRFDFVLEVPVPPRSQRLRILEAATGALLEPRQLARLAESEKLSPAVVTRCAAVVTSIQPQLAPGAVGAAFEHLVNNTLRAQGYPEVAREGSTGIPDIYDPALIHADVDLAEVAQGVIETRTARLCLYGPPGTGKTAWGRWLAEQLGMVLHVKRASDLISKWVGESERNIALAFRQAEVEKAVLLIDEVDSFLRDRRGASASWESSLVNEMLTQMEMFPGVFIASTNLMADLDPAALRRFDVKVRLDYLQPQQALLLFERHASQLGLGKPTAETIGALSRLAVLTPGDFAAVLRQARLRPIGSPHQLLAALEAECAVKGDVPRRSIGFTTR